MPPSLPPRKSNTGTIVTVTLVAVVALVGALVAVLVALDDKKSSSVADSGYGTTAPSVTYDPIPTSEAVTPTQAPSLGSSTSRTTPTRTTTSTPSGPRPVLKTKDNPINNGENGTNVVTCNLPKWQSTPAAAQAFFMAALPCMEAAWAPVMQRAGLPYERPRVIFPSGKRWTSGCGDVNEGEASAFYCPPDVAIYMPFEGLATKQYGNKPGVYLGIFAHEFGHHIQSMSGLMRASHQQAYELGPDSAAGLELSRRLELQANCYNGMWFAGAWNGKGSITDALVRDMLADGYQRGDDNYPSRPRQHGKRQNFGAWLKHGYEKNRTYQCNTYAASATSVS